MPGPLDFLDGEVAVQSDDTRLEQTEAGQPRAADGKFTAAAPEAAPLAPGEAPLAPAPAAAEPAKAPEPGQVPLSAMLDERERRQAAERRIADLEASQSRAATPPAELDPDTENALLQLRLNTSEELVRDKEGDETVDAAKAWAIERFRVNPSYQTEVLGNKNPYKTVVSDYKAHLKLQATQDIDLDGLAEFKAWKAAGGNAPTPPAQLAQPSPATPPRSLASAPSAGGSVNIVPTGPEVAFKNAFSG